MPDEAVTSLPSLPLPIQSGDKLYVARGGVDYEVDGNQINYPFNAASTITLYTEFLRDAATMGWRASTIGSGSTNTWAQNPTAGVYSAAEIRTGTTSGAGCYVMMAGGATGILMPMDGTKAFDLRYRIATEADISQFNLLVGLVNTGGAALPTDGVWFRYDTSQPDTHFRAVVRASSVNTLGADSFSAPALNALYEFRIWSTGAGDMNFSINGGTTVTINTGFPSVRGVPFVTLTTNGAVDQRCLIQTIAGTISR